MSATRDTGFLRNVIQVHDTGVRIMSGSTMLMAISSSGAVTTTGVISGSDAANSLLLNGTGSVGFTTTGSFLAVSSSYTSLSASYNTFSGSASTRISNSETSSNNLTNASASFSSRTTQIENVYATTGSNSFRATQSITGSLTVTGQIIAQTINVQQVTSSIVYSSGSNVFGCDINSRQTFTGSFYQTGSSAIFSNQVCGLMGNFSCLSVGTTTPLGGATEKVIHLSDSGCGYATVYVTNNTNTVKSILAIASATNVGYVGMQSNSDFQIRTNDTERIRISCNGSVSLGTITPKYDWYTQAYIGLQINGSTTVWGRGTDSHFSSNYYVKCCSTNGVASDTYIANGYANDLWFDNNAGQLRYRVGACGTADTAISWTTPFQICSNGYTSINTTADGYAMLCLVATGGDAGIYIRGGSTNTGGWTIQAQNSCNFVIVDRTAGTNPVRLQISSGGNMSVGAATTPTKFYVVDSNTANCGCTIARFDNSGCSLRLTIVDESTTGNCAGGIFSNTGYGIGLYSCSPNDYAGVKFYTANALTFHVSGCGRAAVGGYACGNSYKFQIYGSSAVDGVGIFMCDTNSNKTYSLRNDGPFSIRDVSAGVDRFVISSAGITNFSGQICVLANNSLFGTSGATGRGLRVQASSGGGAIQLINASGGDGTISAYGGATSMNYSFSTYQCGDVFFICNNGLVGIGTITPNNRLEIQKTGAQSAAIFINQCSSDEASIRFKSTHSVGSDYRVGASIQFDSAWEVYNPNICRSIISVSPCGAVQLGNTGQSNSQDPYVLSSDPVHKIGFLGGGTAYARLMMQERTGCWISFNNGGGTNYGVISQSGAGVNYGSNSDYRLKTNVRNMVSACGLSRIMCLRPVIFDWIEQCIEGEGFIAHELQEYIPSAVSGEKDALNEHGYASYQSVDAKNIVPSLVKAIQEQQCKIALLESCLGIS